MTKRNGTKKKRLRRALIVLLVLALACGGSLAYLGTYYRADEAAVAAFAPADVPCEHTAAGDLVFDPGDAETGLIFYPGGKVEAEAYIPLMRAVAAEGVFCVLRPMPFRLAVLDIHAADGVRGRYPAVACWYIGGHSLGGATAAYELSAHPGAYEGLVLLAAYSAADLSGEPVRALSVYGSEDGVLNRTKYERCRANLPADTRELALEGACHAGFGFYGPQRGDGAPALTADAQVRLTASLIAQWITGGGS